MVSCHSKIRNEYMHSIINRVGAESLGCQDCFIFLTRQKYWMYNHMVNGKNSLQAPVIVVLSVCLPSI